MAASDFNPGQDSAPCDNQLCCCKPIARVWIETHSSSIFGRGHQLLHPVLAKQSGKEQAELKRSDSQQIHQLIQILLAQGPPVRHHIQGIQSKSKLPRTGWFQDKSR
jgi:hypothetical protein